MGLLWITDNKTGQKRQLPKNQQERPVAKLEVRWMPILPHWKTWVFIPKNEEYWRFLENEVLEQIVYYENKNYIPLLMSTEPATMWPRDCIPRGQQLALWHMIWDLADIVVLCRLGCGNVPQYL